MTQPQVLVTGGATRIGAEIVKGFAAAGWHVVIHYKESDEQAQALADTLPSAETVGCDLTDPEAAKAMIAELAAHKAAHPEFGIEQVHFFPLGGIKTNATWAIENGGAATAPMAATA